MLSHIAWVLFICGFLGILYLSLVWYWHRSWKRFFKRLIALTALFFMSSVILGLAYWFFPADIREGVERALLSSPRPGLVALQNGTRSAELFVPMADAPTEGRPLLLYLHGYASNGPEAVWFLNLEPMVEEYNLLLLAPDGTANARGVRFWNATEVCCDFKNTGVDDVGYILQLISQVKDLYRVDPKRVYILGHSNGGYMGYRLACEHPEIFRGLVSIAGAGSGREDQCVKSLGLSVLQIHGLRDRIVSYDGHNRDSPSAPRTAELWAQHMACTEPSVEVSAAFDLALMAPGFETDTKVWNNCRDGHSVGLWTMHQAGHIPVFNQVLFSHIWHFLEPDYERKSTSP